MGVLAALVVLAAAHAPTPHVRFDTIELPLPDGWIAEQVSLRSSDGEWKGGVLARHAELHAMLIAAPSMALQGHGVLERPLIGRGYAMALHGTLKSSSTLDVGGVAILRLELTGAKVDKERAGILIHCMPMGERDLTLFWRFDGTDVAPALALKAADAAVRRATGIPPWRHDDLASVFLQLPAGLQALGFAVAGLVLSASIILVIRGIRLDRKRRNAAATKP